LRRGLNDISCTKFHAAFVLGFISTWILSGILSAGSHLCSEIPREKNSTWAQYIDTCNLSGWVLDSSFLFGTHCFLQKIIKNALMGLMMFWLGLVKFVSYYDLLIIFIWCANYINWNAHFLFGMHIIFGVHIIFIGLHIFILCEHKKVCILYLFCVLPGMSYYLFFLQGIFKGHIFTKSKFSYLICSYMGSLRSQYSLKWTKIIITGVDLRKKINWPRGPVKFLNNWPLQNYTGPRNIGPRNRKLKIEQYEPH
jgi:hypothetical protein